MSDITQDEVDSIFREIKNEWDRVVSESGKSEKMFIITDRTGHVSEFMFNYAQAKEHVESLGLVVPAFIDGLEVAIS